MNRAGELGPLVKLILWGVVILLVAAILYRYVIGGAPDVTGTVETLVP